MKRMILLAMMSAGLTLSVQAQKTVVSNEASAKEKVYDVVEQMPEYPGGMSELMKFIGDTMKYPEDAEKQQKEGLVIVRFVVEKDGSVNDVEVVKDAWPSLDAEAIRVVKALPKWTPGKQNGKVVRVKYTIPLRFAIPADEKKK
ncbi:MAG: TonB family protein [Prevotella sp.]|nr:TonB family protein [Prevotella sp.]